MAQQLTAEDARQSLNAHVAEKGMEICVKYGPSIGWTTLLQILQDRSCVRYPCEIVFDQKPLQSGEFGHPVANDEDPGKGFVLYIHPRYAVDLERVAYLVLYQLVLVNYGPFASADDAETFAASALGLSKDSYYEELCAMADAVAGGGSCSCDSHS